MNQPELRYQALLIGPDLNLACPDNPHLSRRQVIERELSDRAMDLGLDPSQHLLVVTDVASPELRPDCPTAVIWLDNSNSAANSVVTALEDLMARGVPVFPVVDSLIRYDQKVPACLRPINGKSWEQRDEALTGVLSTFGLLRSAKRIFISYKRSETEGIARQLFRELQLRGYQAFLDTARIAPGRDVQSDLKSELANVDVVILLHSGEALNSKWVMEEIIDAHIRGTEVIDLLFPEAKRQDDLDLAIPYAVTTLDIHDTGDVERNTLTDEFLTQLLRDIELYRIRSVQTRRNRIIRQLLEDADAIRLTASNHLTGSDRLPCVPHLEFSSPGSEAVVAIVSQGIPDSRELHSRQTSVSRGSPSQALLFADARIVYDEYGVLNEDLTHLHWLNQLVHGVTSMEA